MWSKIDFELVLDHIVKFNQNQKRIHVIYPLVLTKKTAVSSNAFNRLIALVLIAIQLIVILQNIHHQFQQFPNLHSNKQHHCICWYRCCLINKGFGSFSGSNLFQLWPDKHQVLNGDRKCWNWLNWNHLQSWQFCLSVKRILISSNLVSIQLFVTNTSSFK